MTQKIKNPCRICQSREVKYPTSGLCAPCYSGIYYWNKKTPTAIAKRQNQLNVLEARLEEISPVRTLKHKRRA